MARLPVRVAAEAVVAVEEAAAVVAVVAADMPFLAEAAVAEAACDPSAVAAGDRQYPADGRQTLGP